MVEGGSSDGGLCSQSSGGEQSRWEDERPHKTILPPVLPLSWSQEPHQRWSLLCQTLDAEGPRAWLMEEEGQDENIHTFDLVDGECWDEDLLSGLGKCRTAAERKERGAVCWDIVLLWGTCGLKWMWPREKARVSAVRGADVNHKSNPSWVFCMCKAALSAESKSRGT